MIRKHKNDIVIMCILFIFLIEIVDVFLGIPTVGINRFFN